MAIPIMSKPVLEPDTIHVNHKTEPTRELTHQLGTAEQGEGQASSTMAVQMKTIEG